MLTLFSRRLWRGLQTPPPNHWTRSAARPRSSDQTALVLAFALSALMLISGIILSVMVVFRAADRIARARETGTFDLLAVTPGGSFGASWAIFTASLHNGLTLPTLRRLRLNALRAVFIIGLLTLLPLFVTALESGDSTLLIDAWSWLLFYAFVLPMMYFDHIYAVVSGGLIGTLLPDYIRSEARVVAIVAGVLLHLTGYTVAALTGALILPVVYESLGIAGWLADLIRVALALAVFVLAHEAVALLLYRAAQLRLNHLEIIPPVTPAP